MRTLFRAGLICIAVLIVASPLLAGGVSAESAFAQLKSMSGTWTGEAEGEGEEAEVEAGVKIDVVHEIQLSAGGTVVMETMGPGTPHEMINMYHVDGDDLQLTHYCAGGNQPTMRLDRENSTSERLVFVFTGGTNLDPEVDSHIHSAELVLIDADHVQSNWAAFVGDKQVGRMSFQLARSE